MATRIPLLSNVKVAAPCSASWEAMKVVDGERVRFCQDCKLNVYNISEMTQAQAEGLLRAHEGRLCVRYYERKDGTIMTRNCPMGLQALRIRIVRRSVAAAVLFLISNIAYSKLMPHTMGDVLPRFSQHDILPPTAELQTEPPADTTRTATSNQQMPEAARCSIGVIIGTPPEEQPEEGHHKAQQDKFVGRKARSHDDSLTRNEKRVDPDN